MSFDQGYNRAMAAAGLTKTAEPSNYAQDFLAGLDPFGAFTNEYGMLAERAGLSEGEHALKRGIGTAGGVVGGTVLVPGAITAITEGIKEFAGAKGGVGKRLGAAATGASKGFIQPVKSVSEGLRGRKALRRVADGGSGLTPREQQALTYVGETAGVTPDSLAQSIDQAKGIVGKQYDTSGSLKELVGRLDPEQIQRVSMTPDGRRMAAAAEPQISSRLNTGMAQLGIGGAIGAGGAYYQYGAGRETERQTSPLARLKRVFTE